MDYSNVDFNTMIDDVSGTTAEKVVYDGKGPGPRRGHMMGLLGERLILWGGSDGEGLNEIFMLDIDRLVWDKIVSNSSDFAWRANFGVGHHGSTSFVIFGGEGEESKVKSELLILEKQNVSCPFVAGNFPEARKGLGLAQVSEDTWLLCGGVNQEICGIDMFELRRVQTKRESRRWNQEPIRNIEETRTINAAHDFLFDRNKRLMQIRDATLAQKQERAGAQKQLDEVEGGHNKIIADIESSHFQVNASIEDLVAKKMFLQKKIISNIKTGSDLDASYSTMSKKLKEIQEDLINKSNRTEILESSLGSLTDTLLRPKDAGLNHKQKAKEKIEVSKATKDKFKKELTRTMEAWKDLKDQLPKIEEEIERYEALLDDVKKAEQANI